jgi:carbon-monoxide dehydrogenase large subunit
VADAIGAAVENVEVVQGDTATSPWGLGTWGSRSAVVAGGCLALASSDVRRKILSLASKLLEAAVDDLRVDDSRVYVAGSPDRSVHFGEIARAAYFSMRLRETETDPSLTSTRFYDPAASYSNGCILVVVEVDVETGIV